MAQGTVSGLVVDAQSGTTLPYVNVTYVGHNVGGMTNEEGHFSLPYHKGWAKLQFSCVGFETKTVTLTGPIRNLRIELKMNAHMVNRVTVKGKKKKYNRKNNPAVELMKKVIEAAKLSDLKQKDYYHYNKYSRMTTAFNDVSEKLLEEDRFKKMPFLKDRVELAPETGKLILPINVEETVTEYLYRKQPHEEKSIVDAKKATGINDFFNTGDMVTTLLEDVFTDVNVYDHNIRLLQNQFPSPIAGNMALQFYRYFIADTVLVGRDSCYEVTFTPNNVLDMGFSGSLYVVKDGTYRLRKISLNTPHKGGVNFVDNLQVTQEFTRLPGGEQVLIDDNMLVEINVVGSVTKICVRRANHYYDYSFAPIDDHEFRFLGKQKIMADANFKDNAYWAEVRPNALSEKEATMDVFLKQMTQVRGFKFVLWCAKTIVENFIETSTDPDHPSKVDIGPVNTIISHNDVNGLRLRASAQTTANLNPHLFWKGYLAYGRDDNRWMGKSEITYSFNRKAYLPREFPVNNLTFSYTNDVMSASEQSMPTDKDNVFTSFKWTDANHMQYYENFRLTYDREWSNGFRLTTSVQHEKDTPTSNLFYQKLSTASEPTADPALWTDHIRRGDATVALHYQPNATYLNTKQRRITANNDAPIYTLSHTFGLKMLGATYRYNLTEASVYKRFYIPAGWGRCNVQLQAGAQWNRVPFPMLIIPATNLSYIRERFMFSLIRDMEFLNDRYVSLMCNWDLYGKIFNRIPLLRKLKWREYAGVNLLWGKLTDKNNPLLEKNQGSSRLFYLPGNFKPDGSYESISHVMGNKPYVEAAVGVSNIFKLFHFEVVRRLTYTDLPGVKKWGWRVLFDMSF